VIDVQKYLFEVTKTPKMNIMKHSTNKHRNDDDVCYNQQGQLMHLIFYTSHPYNRLKTSKLFTIFFG